MASAEQIKALLKSHVDGDDNRFFSVAMQVAAHEARLGHGKLAEELRAMIDDAKGRRGAGAPVPIGRPRGELATLLETSYPKARLSEMILNDVLADQIRRVIREQRHAGRIRGARPVAEALKDALIHERPRVREVDIRTMLEERSSVAERSMTQSRSQESIQVSSLNGRQNGVAR